MVLRLCFCGCLFALCRWCVVFLWWCGGVSVVLRLCGCVFVVVLLLREALEKRVVDKWWRRVLEESVVEKCWRRK